MERRQPNPEFFPQPFIDIIIDEVHTFDHYVIGISGPSGAGKTTLAGILQARLRPTQTSTLISADDYFMMSRAQMRQESLTGYHWETRDREELLDDVYHLKSGIDVTRQGWDPVSETPRTVTRTYKHADIILIEGTLDFSEFADYSVFIKIPDDLIIARRLERDRRKTSFHSPAEMEQYVRQVSIPTYRHLLEPLSKRANIIFDSGSGLTLINKLSKNIKASTPDNPPGQDNQSRR